MQVIATYGKRKSLAVIVAAILTSLVSPTCALLGADCEVPAAAPGFSACFPKGWWFSVGDGNRVFACSGPPPCTGTGGGFPLTGRMLATIVPATALKWDPRDNNLTDMMNEHVKGSCEARTVVEIPRESQGLAREIQLWECPYPGGYPGTLTYGLRLRERLFLVLFEFSDETENREKYRREAAEIVHSIRLTGEQ